MRGPQDVYRHRGDVWVGAHHVAELPLLGFYAISRLMEDVRERTSDEWWRHASEVALADDIQTPGPLGLGVDFFVDTAGVAVPDDVRDAIQDEAYEAAREVIVTRIEEHCRKMAVAAEALR
jgi:hypothetical protein